MKKISRNRYGIKYKYIFAILPFLFLSYLTILLVVILFYYHSVSIFSSKQENTLNDITSSNLNQHFDRFERDFGFFLYKTDIQNALKKVAIDKDPKATEELSAKLTSNISFYPSFNDNYINNLYLYAADGSYYSASGKITDPSIASNIQLAFHAIKEQVHLQHGQIYFGVYHGPSDIFLIARDIYLWTGETSTTGKIYLGTLIAELNVGSLKYILRANDDCYSFVLADSDNEILINTTGLDSDFIYENIASDKFSLNDQKYHTLKTKLHFNELSLILVTNETLLHKPTNTIILLQIIISVLSCILIIFSIFHVSSLVSSEFQYFINKLEETSSLSEITYIHMDSFKEFTVLSNVYNDMINRLRTLTSKIHEQQLLTKDAQIQNLQSQINPHFLYNTLNCISGLIDLNRKEDSKKALSALADIERMSLKGAPFCTIQEDLLYIRKYLFIQQLRFEDKLVYLIEIDEKIQQYYIPKLILQPIVENAILHGTSEITSKGFLGIFAEVKENTLYISIKDNGPGFPEDFEASLKKNRFFPFHALLNIDKRLKLFYGNEYGLTFSNNTSGGACTTIMLPVINQLSKETPNETINC